MHPFLNGLLFGLIFLFSLGPAFFALIHTSLEHGKKSAIFFAIGISLSDLIYVMLALLGLSAFLDDPEIKFWIAILGTVMLLSYAVYSWNKKPKYHATKKPTEKINFLKYTLKGIILNGLNPFALFFWITIIGLVSVRHDYSFSEQIMFFSGTLCTIFSLDMIKIILSRRLSHLISPPVIIMMNRSLGIILFLFSLRIMYFLFDNYIA